MSPIFSLLNIAPVILILLAIEAKKLVKENLTSASAEAYSEFDTDDINDVNLGSPAIPNAEYSYEVLIKNGYTMKCDGTIITQYYILTSARCIHNGGSPTIYITIPSRKHDIVITGVEKIIHPEFEQRYLVWLNDIALIKLPEALNFTEDFQPVRLENDDDLNYMGQTAKMINWDFFMTFRKLASKRGVIVSNQYCPFIDNDELLDNLFCFKKTDEFSVFCRDKTGGTLLINGTQVGIASISNIPCSDPTYFLKVANYIDWIEENSDYSSSCVSCLLNMFVFLICILFTSYVNIFHN